MGGKSRTHVIDDQSWFYCEHENELSDFVKSGEFRHNLMILYRLLKKNPAPRSFLKPRDEPMHSAR
jgi:hypothetical protein